MNRGSINEISITQANHTPGNPIGIGQNVLKVTIKCSSLSANNVFIGINGPANNANVLQPGESVTYHDERVELTDNEGDGLRLYIGFDSTGSGGAALVSVIRDEKKPSC